MDIRNKRMLEMIVLAQSIFIIIGVCLAVIESSDYRRKIKQYEIDIINLSAECSRVKSESTVIDNQISNLIIKMNKTA